MRLPWVSRRKYEREVLRERTWATDILANREDETARADRYHNTIESVRAIHHPYPQNDTGVDAYAKWYCKGCRTAWPCATWKATAPNYEFPTQLQLEWKRKP